MGSGWRGPAVCVIAARLAQFQARALRARRLVAMGGDWQAFWVRDTVPLLKTKLTVLLERLRF